MEERFRKLQKDFLKYKPKQYQRYLYNKLKELNFFDIASRYTFMFNHNSTRFFNYKLDYKLIDLQKNFTIPNLYDFQSTLYSSFFNSDEIEYQKWLKIYQRKEKIKHLL